MSREIKFRAWDKEAKRFLDVESHFSDEVSITPDDETRGTFYPAHFEADQSTVQLMQYTGLKDKNGREIYEGDILEWRYLSPEDRELEEANVNRGSVEFEFGSWYFNIPNPGPLPSAQMLWKLHDYMTTESGENWGDAIYVIGNVWENPELLK